MVRARTGCCAKVSKAKGACGLIVKEDKFGGVWPLQSRKNTDTFGGASRRPTPSGGERKMMEVPRAEGRADKRRVTMLALN